MASHQHTTPSQRALMFSEPEEWRPIPGYEGMYEVSTWGRVRSLERYVRSATAANGLLRLRSRILRGTTPRPYDQVQLSREGIQVPRMVHLLVLEAFVGPRPPGYVANHRDSNTKNNAVTNLEWVTPQQNTQQAVDRLALPRGIRHYRAKLTEAQVKEIRQRAAQGESARSLGRLFGVSVQTISPLLHRITWKHIP